MITRIQALGYRCLRHVDQRLSHFHVLVGANASGKSTFLDVPRFIGDVVEKGLEEAIQDRTSNFHDLCWRHAGGAFELAIEAEITDSLKTHLRKHPRGMAFVRYELGVRYDAVSDQVSISHERLVLLPQEHSPTDGPLGSASIFCVPSEGSKTVIERESAEAIRFNSESAMVNGSSEQGILIPASPTLAGLSFRPLVGHGQVDDNEFVFVGFSQAVAGWLANLLATSVSTTVLSDTALRDASPPGQGRKLRPNGGNLPGVVEQLKGRAPEQFGDWIAHLRTALPDLVDIRVIELEHNRHKYLKLCYDSGIEVPSWMVSDGTLRLLALTLPAYLPDLSGTLMIEEPENGIHPRALETLMHSFRSVYGAQLLVTTHSPLLLGLAEPAEVLCFSSSPERGTEISAGDRHPALRDWRRETDLGVLFASGILG